MCSSVRKLAKVCWYVDISSNVAKAGTGAESGSKYQHVLTLIYDNTFLLTCVTPSDVPNASKRRHVRRSERAHRVVHRVASVALNAPIVPVIASLIASPTR